MEISTCRICNESFSKQFVFREMMFGFRDEFTYTQCSNCSAIQIREIPADLDKYYPPHYVSFTQNVPTLKRLLLHKRLIKNIRIKRKYKVNGHHLINYLKHAQVKPSAKILDIGCGKGTLICSLFNLGFENITGVDKFITNEIDHGHGVKVYKKELSELKTNAYDVLTMHHVLEHIDEQIAELEQCHRLLKKNGVLIISIPIIGEAWEIYRENWVQLDAPRHFVLHTKKSIALLAEKTGFKIKKTVFESTAFQFWGSELYKKDIPLAQPETNGWDSSDKGFSMDEIAVFEQKAAALNANNEGDTARFYFYKN